MTAAGRHSGKTVFLFSALVVTLAIRLSSADFAPTVVAAMPEPLSLAVFKQLAALPQPARVRDDAATPIAFGEGDIAEREPAAAASPAAAPALDELEPAAPDADHPAAPGTDNDVVQEVVEVQRGDTLIEVLVNSGVSQVDAYGAVDALTDLFTPRDLKPGQEIALTFSLGNNPPEGGTGLSLVGLTLQPSVEQDLQVTRGLDGGFTALAIDRPLVRRDVAIEGTIDSSLFEAAEQQGVPFAVLADLIRAFSYDVDFQREIQPGDKFELLYDQFDDEAGNFAKTGELIYASLTLSGRDLEIYRFMPESGFADFFTPKGESVRKALLRTPIDGARITSGFGLRNHPILGYSKMHKGVDFGAPQGTPIFAAGDGVIVKIGRQGSYGNYVQIRHNSEYATAYAHMSRFAKGLEVGSRVRQGDVIGYVGATGRATGPHLHYEVLMAGKQTNPLDVKLPAGEKLAGDQLIAFKARMQEIDGLRQRTKDGTFVAEAPAWSPADCNAAPTPDACNN